MFQEKNTPTQSQDQEISRAFKGIWIPREIWLHKDLSYFEKMLWSEISSLDDPERGCIASNAYLQKFFSCTERFLQLGLAKLKKLGLIKYASTDGRTRVLRSFLKTYHEKFDTPRVKKSTPQECRNQHPYNKEEKPLSEVSSSLASLSPKEESQAPVPLDLPVPKGQPQKPVSQEALELAEFFHDKFVRLNPNASKNIVETAQVFDSMPFLNQGTAGKEDICAAINYFFETPFWHKIINSAEMFKKKFDTIYRQMERQRSSERIVKNFSDNKKTAQKLLRKLKKQSDNPALHPEDLGDVNRILKCMSIEKNHVLNSCSLDTTPFSLPKDEFINDLIENFLLQTSDFS